MVDRGSGGSLGEPCSRSEGGRELEAEGVGFEVGIRCYDGMYKEPEQIEVDEVEARNDDPVASRS